MESLACAVSGRQFQQLLVGISKRLFYDGENEFTHAYLATQCYAGVELQPEDVYSQIIAYEQVVIAGNSRQLLNQRSIFELNFVF